MRSIFSPVAGTPCTLCAPAVGWRTPHPCRQLATALVLWCGMASGATASTPPTSTHSLTLEAALEAVQVRSATLQAQDAATLASQEMAVAAGRLPDPVLRMSLDNVPVQGPMRYSLSGDFMTMRSVGMMQTFVDADKREARSTRYQRQAQVSVAMRAMQQSKLLVQTARAWLDRYFHERMLELLQRQREETRQVGMAVEAGYRGGRDSQADVVAAHAAVAHMDDRLQEVRTQLTNAQTLLARWVGDAAAQPLGTPPNMTRTRLAEHAVSHTVDQYPQLRVMQAREQVAEAEVQVAQHEKKADWSWSLMYSQRGSRFSDMVSLGVSIPLQWDQPQKQDRELAATLARLEQVRWEREEVRREHVAQVQSLFTSWRSNLTRVQDYDKTLLVLARDRVQATQAAFSSGQAPLVAVIQAQRMVTDVLLERLRIERQAAMEWAELEFLVDQPTTEQVQP